MINIEKEQQISIINTEQQLKILELLTSQGLAHPKNKEAYEILLSKSWTAFMNTVCKNRDIYTFIIGLITPDKTKSCECQEPPEVVSEPKNVAEALGRQTMIQHWLEMGGTYNGFCDMFGPH